jgi:hypothetical protein
MINRSSSSITRQKQFDMNMSALLYTLSYSCYILLIAAFNYYLIGAHPLGYIVGSFVFAFFDMFLISFALTKRFGQPTPKNVLALTCAGVVPFAFGWATGHLGYQSSSSIVLYALEIVILLPALWVVTSITSA